MVLPYACAEGVGGRCLATCIVPSNAHTNTANDMRTVVGYLSIIANVPALPTLQKPPTPAMKRPTYLCVPQLSV